MEKETDKKDKKKRFGFFNLTNERVVDLLSYSKCLYYFGVIETILFFLSVAGIPLIGFTLMSTSFNENPSLDRVDIYIRWRYMVTVITLVIIVAMSLFTNWPKCVSELVVQNEQEVWSTVCKPRGTPFALFFSLLAVIIIQVWAVYIAEMYRLRYKELKEDSAEWTV